MSNKIMIGGNIFYYATSYNETKKLLDFCYDQNIRAIDTADVYSEGKSEEYTGRIIKQNRAKWFIATKCGVRSSQSSDYVNTKKNLYKRIEKSLLRLKTDFVDLYQLHHHDEKTDIQETFGALEDLKKEGKIINYGISNFNFFKCKKIIKHYKIFSHQINYNILNYESYEEAQKTFNNANYIAYNVLGRGLLRTELFLDKRFKTFRSLKSFSIRNDMKNDSLYKYLNVINIFARIYDLKIQQIAFRYVLDNKKIKFLILGIRKISQIKEFLGLKNKINWGPIVNEIKKIKYNNKFEFSNKNFL
jgi:aryl-alcohol dehydrogenase-like predicted oxidoreductase